MFRHINTPMRVFAFSAKPLQSPMTRFRGKRTHSIITAKESNQTAHAGTVSSKTCQGFSPYSLVQQEQECVSSLFPESGSRICHKSRINIRFSRRGRPRQCGELPALITFVFKRGIMLLSNSMKGHGPSQIKKHPRICRVDA